MPRDGRFIEKIGSYNPLLAKTDEKRVQYDEERVKHWIGVGAKPTDRVARFLSVNGLAEWKAGSNPNKAKPVKSSGPRAGKKDKIEAAKAAAAEAAAAPAEEPAADDAAAE